MVLQRPTFDRLEGENGHLSAGEEGRGEERRGGPALNLSSYCWTTFVNNFQMTTQRREIIDYGKNIYTIGMT